MQQSLVNNIRAWAFAAVCFGCSGEEGTHQPTQPAAQHNESTLKAKLQTFNAEVAQGRIQLSRPSRSGVPEIQVPDKGLVYRFVRN
jgi:hypothetical protein